MKELITKYLSNDCTAEEHAMLLDWVISSEENKEEFTATSQQWHSAARLNQEKKIDSTKAFAEFKSKIKSSTNTQPKKETKVISLWKKISSVAAIAILTVGSFYLFNQNDDIQMISKTNNQNTIAEVTLKDGSSVYLHKGASIEYPSCFESNARNIKISGHVFCEVARNENAPFTVSTKNFNVQVLGTAFDIQEKANTSEVIVARGKVQVSTQDNQSVILEKNQRADFSEAGLVKSNNTDVNFLSWQTGILVFEATPLQKVFSDLERHFDCKITVENDKINTEKLDGEFQDYELESIVSIINQLFPKLVFTYNDSDITVSLQE